MPRPLLVLALVLAAPALRAQSFEGLGVLDSSVPMPSSYAADVSGDGAVVVGHSARYTPFQGGGYEVTNRAFRWEDGAMALLPLLVPEYNRSFNEAWGVSVDGSRAVGYQHDIVQGGGLAAVRWTGSGGAQHLPTLPSDGWVPGAQAIGASADGSVAVGRSSSSSGPQAVRWAGGVQALGRLPGGGDAGAEDVTPDGEIVVGWSARGGIFKGSHHAFRWEDGTMQDLGLLPGASPQSDESYAYAVSADGTIVVGRADLVDDHYAVRWVDGVIESLGPGRATDVSAAGRVVVGDFCDGIGTGGPFLWAEGEGVRDLRAVLVDSLGLDLTGWTLGCATALSADGSTVVGVGTNPAGHQEAWRAVLASEGLTYTLDARPDEVEVGDTITVAVGARNGLEVPLTDARPDGPMEATSEDGVEVTLLTGPEPATIALLAPGASDTLRYTFVVAAAARGAAARGPLGGLIEFFVGLLATDPDGQTVEGTNECAEPPCGAVTVTAGLLVNSTDDDADEDLEDGACNTGQEVEIEDEMVPECTLRAAIDEANAQPGADEIAFAIPGAGPHTIRPAGSALPPLDVDEDPIVLDATTQPGYDGAPLIFLDGSLAGVNASGLRVVGSFEGETPVGGESTIKGFAIGNFGWYGLLVQSGGNNTIEANYVGTDASGNGDAGNGREGIYLAFSFSNTLRGNVVSANDSSGVSIESGGDNRLFGNRIGTNAAGTSALPNGGDGIRVETVFDPPSIIGGPGPDEGNLISGNTGVGLRTERGDVVGNRIGTNAAGTAALPNVGGGVLYTGTGYRIEGNVISGNAEFGLHVVATSRTGSGSENTIVGNYIGTNAEGTAALHNDGPGLWLDQNARENVVGGPAEDERNVISGNAGDGVLLTQPDDGFGSSTRGNRIAGNYIGTDATGTRRVPNEGAGVHADFRDVRAEDVTDDVIGVDADENQVPATPVNVISGNLGPGVWVEGYCFIERCQELGVRVEGNYIGTDATGTAALGNGGPGVLLDDGSGTVVAKNLISANAEGVVAQGDFSPSLFTAVALNVIGSDLGETVPLGNLGDGVRVAFDMSTPRLCGFEGIVNVGSNTIAGNRGHGVAVSGHMPGAWQCGPLASHVDVTGNNIGFTRTADGAIVAMGNDGAGVFLGEGSEINHVRRRNTIAYNGGPGIAVTDGFGQWLADNLIFTNGGPAIDLGNDGPTPNDRLDEDDGPNDLTNYPLFEVAYLSNGEVFVAGSMAGLPFTNYTVDLHVEAQGREGFGEAQGFLGRQVVETPLDLDTDDGSGQHIRFFTTRFAASAEMPFVLDAPDRLPLQEGWRLRGLASYSPLGSAGNLSFVSTSELDAVSVLIENAPEMDEDVAGGDTRLSLGGDGFSGGTGQRASGFAAGDTLTVCPACANEEVVAVAAVEPGALVLTEPLARAHAAGEAVVPFARAVASVLVRADTLAAFGAGTAVAMRFDAVTGGGTVTAERFRRAPAAREGIAEPTVLPHRWVASLDSTLAFAESTEIRIALWGIPNLTLERPEDVVVYHRPVPGTGAFAALPTRFDTTASAFVASGLTALGEFVLATDEDVDTGEEEPEVPEAFALSAAYPNPFNPSTVLNLDMPEAGAAAVTVYDALGRRVAVLLDGAVEAGTHPLRFDARGLPSGVYFVRAVTAQGTQTRRVTLLR